MKRAITVAVCGLLSSLLVACYDLTPDGLVITGATVNLYRLDDQQTLIKTIISETNENPTANGALNFFTMPQGYSPDDVYYLVEACGGQAQGVPQEGCRYAIIAARYFFLEDQGNDWEGRQNFWYMTRTTDAMARVVKDTYSHNELLQIQSVLDEVTATYFPALDGNGDESTTYNDLTHATDGDYGIEVSEALLTQISDALTAALAQEEPEPDPVPDPNPEPTPAPEPIPDPTPPPEELVYPSLAIELDGTEAGRGFQFRSLVEVCLEPEGGNLDELDIDYTLYLKITQPDSTPLEEAGSILLPLDEDDCYTVRLDIVGPYNINATLLTDAAGGTERIRASTVFRSEDEPATPAPPDPFDVKAACEARAAELGFINVENATFIYACPVNEATGGECGPDDLGRTVPIGDDVCYIAYQ